MIVKCNQTQANISNEMLTSGCRLCAVRKHTTLALLPAKALDHR
jgi:hypothetical protein